MKKFFKTVTTLTITAAMLAACGKGGESGETGAPAPTASSSPTEVVLGTPVPLVTDSPTVEPTLEPTVEPTTEPTAEPTPEPTPEPPVKPYVLAQGIYITAPMAGNSRFESRFDLTQTTDLNAMVVDVKTDDGQISFYGIDFLDELGVSENYISDPRAFVRRLHDGGIYAIARVVCFKDNSIVDSRPDLALHVENGAVYREYLKPTGMAWLNPYNRDVWKYLGDVAEAVASYGFDEIQLDYVRFPTDSAINHVTFTEETTGGLTKEEAIIEFGKYMKERLNPYPVVLAADVYGSPIWSSYDASLIGQNFAELLKVFDVVCPMLYPSHYAGGTFGIEYPDLQPYETVSETLKIANVTRDKVLAENGYAARIRPWIQDFAAPWLASQGLKYQLYWGPQVKAQIDACADNGIFEFLIWDAVNDYDGYRDLVGQPY